MYAIKSKEGFGEALEIAKKVLRVNPKAFEHYVEKGKRNIVPFEFNYEAKEPDKMRAFVEVVHSLFSASNYRERLKGLKIEDDLFQHFHYHFPPSHKITVFFTFGGAWHIFGALIHEYTHAVELNQRNQEPIEVLYNYKFFKIMDHWGINTEVKNISEKLISKMDPKCLENLEDLFPLPKAYELLLYSFVDREHSSQRIELAFINPELLIAFYQILELKENPLKMIEEAMGWEGIFAKELSKTKINQYVEAMSKITETIKESEEIKSMDLFSENPELWNFALLKPRVWPRETLLQPKFPFFETSYPRA